MQIKTAIKNFILISIGILLFSMPIYSQSKWVISTNLQMNSGSYFFGSPMNAYYLYGGVRYQETEWGFSLSLPLIATNGGSVSQLGNTYLPTQNEMHGSGSNNSSNDSHGGMMGTGFLSGMDISNGDLYINGNYFLLKQGNSTLDIYLNGFIKVPLADENIGLGTGKFDYNMSVGVRKNIKTFIFLAELGYLILGDANEIKYNNPVTYSIGAGTFNESRDLGIILSYSGYSKVIDGYSAPSLLSLGVIFKSSHMMGYNIIISKGLSEINPDYVLSAGINLGI